MKKLLLILAFLLIVALGAALVLPSFIDWNPYRDEIAARIEAATGRPAAIDGDLSLRVLPSPTLSVEGVRLANIPDGSTRDMARIGALEVAVDLAPLLRGEVRVRSVRVVEPVVLLERLPDGRANWAFQARRSVGDGRSVSGPLPGTDPAPPPPPARDDNSGGLTVRLDDVRIEAGLVVYRDRARGTDLRIEAIETTLSAESLRGPFRVRGDVRVGDVAVALDVATGSVETRRSTPLDANLFLPATGDTLALSGTVAGPLGDPTFSGRIEGTAGRLSATLALLLGREGGALLARPATISGQVAASVMAVTVSDLRLGVGEAEVRGRVAATYGADTPLDMQATLRVRALDLDAWLASVPPAQGADDATDDATNDGGGPLRPGLSLPTDLTATLDLSAEALTWRGEVVRRLAVAARLDDGRLTVESASAALPGASQVTVSGAVDAREGLPRVSGSVQARSGNLREVLTWLRLPVGAVPADRLRAFDASARLDGTPETLNIRDIDLTLDTTRATGAVVMRPGARLGLGLNVSLDSVNLDAYWPGGGGAGDTGGADAVAPAGGLPAWLESVDANFRIAIGLLTADALPFRTVRAEGSLVRGRLALKQAGVDRVAGLRLTARGGLSRVDGRPRADHLTITAEADDLSRTARLLRMDLPASAHAALQALGTVTQTVTLSGTADALDVTTAARFQDGGLDSTGRLKDLLGPTPAYDLAVDLRHPDAERLVRLLVPDYVPRGSPLGGIALATQARGDAGEIDIEGFGLRLGDIQMTGQARLALAGERPHLTADVRTTALPLDAFLPLAREARQRLGVQHLLIPAAWSSPTIDLSALTLLDADVTLRATALGFGPHTLEDAKITARLADGTMRLERLSGLLYGGQAEGTATVAAGAPARGDLTLSVTGFSVARLLGQDRDDGAAGTGTLDLDLAGTGASADDLVDGLTGTARLTLHGLDVSTAQVRGTALAGLLEPVAALNDLTDSLVGGLDRAQRLVDVDGWFVINDGAVGFDPLRLASALYEADVAGTVDLRAWTIDAEGVADLAQGPLRQAVGRVIRLPERVPIALNGALDAPAVTLRTASLPAGTADPANDAEPTRDEDTAAEPPDPPDPVVDDMLHGVTGAQ